MKTFTVKNALLEIIFIVIGILIAVSINNWNEKRKFKAEEQEFLLDLQESLKADSLDATDNLSALQMWLKDLVVLEKALKSGQPYHDSLDVYFGNLGTYIYFIPSSKSKFEELQSRGFNLIHNRELRKSFLEYYSFDIFTVVHTEQLHMDSRKVIQAYYFKHFVGWGYEASKPNDPKIMSDPQLLQLVKNKKYLYALLNKQYSQYLIPKILKLQKDVCEELGIGYK